MSVAESAAWAVGIVLLLTFVTAAIACLWHVTVNTAVVVAFTVDLILIA